VSDPSGVFFYRAYGLIIESQLVCPDLVPVSDTTPDVVVSYGNVPDQLENIQVAGWKFQANADQVLIKTDRIASILVSQGKRVVIEPKAGAGEDDVRALLLGWGMGALLHQRNVLPLHGSAISVGDECVTFCAPSGTGKSSMATLFVKRGYRLLDDNIVAIDYLDGAYMVHPGSPVIKLPDDVLQKPDYSFVTPGPFLPALRKYPMRIRQDYSSHPQLLKKIYILTRGEAKAHALMPLAGRIEFDYLMKNVFCLRFLQGMDKLSHQFRTLESIAARTPVMEVRLPDWPMPYDHVADLVEQDFVRASD
jgi:hypothetical protein